MADAKQMDSRLAIYALCIGGLFFVLFFTCSAFPAERDEDNQVQVVLQLDDNRTYALVDLACQLNRHFGATYDIEPLEGIRQEILPAEQASLLLIARFTDWFDVTFDDDSVTLTFCADREPASTRWLFERILPRSLPVAEYLYRLELPEADGEASRLVLLVHGLGSSPEAFRNMASALSNQDHSVAFYHYPKDAPPEQSARMLSSKLRTLAKETPQLRIDVIAHSLGGLITRRIIEDPALRPGNVDRVFLLAVPHGGSNLAVVRTMWEIIRLLDLEVELGELVSDFAGSPGRSLTPGSSFLNTLATGARPRGVTYYQVIGSGAPFSEEEWLVFIEMIRNRLDDRDASPWVRARVLGRMESLMELRAGEGDGAVSIVSATLEGACQSKTVPFGHREIQRLEQVNPVEDHPVFQWIIDRLDEPIRE